MSKLMISEDGRYMSGDIPFGYALWGDRLVEQPRELDACVTVLRLVKQGKEFPEISASVEQEHGVRISRDQFEGLCESAYRRYGPLR